MPESSRQINILVCPGCGAENYKFATFCISCGDPFDAPGDSALDFTLQYDKPSKAPKAEGQEAQVNARPAQSLSSRLARRETVLGVALLVLVIGYAIFNWQRTSDQSAAYKEGVVAEGHKDWDKAADAFERAGDQRDATGKASHARVQVAERNRLYGQALEAADRQDWTAAVPALEGVLAIQPAFADSAERLVQARTQAYKLELSDLIYLVSDGPNPGLYMLGEDNQPYRLPGSDGESLVRAMSPDGTRFVYDRPKGDMAASTPASGQGGVPDAFNDTTVKRMPVLATLQNRKITTRLMPDLNGGGTGTFSPGGLWWYSGWYSMPKEGDYLQYEIAYSDGGRQVSHTVVVTNPFSATRTLALDPPRSRLVLGAGRGEPRTVGRHTRIMLADADGTSPLDVGSVDGDVQSAEVSRDGRWLLAVTQYAIARVGVERTVWLVALEGDVGKPRKLETTSVSGIEIPPRLIASLVPAEEQATRLIVDRAGADSERLTLYDADGATSTHIVYNLPDEFTGYDSQGFSGGGRFLGLRRQSGEKATLEVIDLGGDGLDSLRTHSLPLPAQRGQAVKVSFAPRGNYVLASVQNRNGPFGDNERTVYAAHMNSDGSLGGLKSIATTTTKSDRQLPAMAFTSGGTLLAYVATDHRLHVTFYDGVQDAAITEGVSAVWALGQQADHSWSR